MPINMDAVQSGIARKGAYLLGRIQDGDPGSPDWKTRTAFVEFLALSRAVMAEVRLLDGEIRRLTDALNAGAPVLEEAADRIEKLEYALNQIVDGYRQSMDCQDVYKIAKDALAESV